MTLYRQARKCREWWDTDFSRRWMVTPWLARRWGRLFAPLPYATPDNARDHISRW